MAQQNGQIQLAGRRLCAGAHSLFASEFNDVRRLNDRRCISSNRWQVNNLGQRPRICILRSTRDVAISDQLKNRVNFAPTVAPGFSIARFSSVPNWLSCLDLGRLRCWTRPLPRGPLGVLAISWSSSTCTRTGRRRVAALGSCARSGQALGSTSIFLGRTR